MKAGAPLAPMPPPPALIKAPRPRHDPRPRPKPKIVAPRQSKVNRSDPNPLQRSSEFTHTPRLRPPDQPNEVGLNPRFRRPPNTTRPIRIGAIPNGPLSPMDAVKSYGGALTPFELTEILNFPEIYYLGSLPRKVQFNASDPRNSGFDDANGHYRLMPGDHLAFRFEVLQILGSGAFGQVCLCTDHKANQQVAVKVVVNTKQMQEQGAVEGKILGRLNQDQCRNIVRAFDYFVFRNHVCISFEVLGKSLFTLMKENEFKPFDTAFVRGVAQQMFRALSDIHKCGVVHCDVKPENVLQGASTLEFKLIDFGSGCFNGQQRYQYIQSRFYRAPEVILGFRYSYPMDVWSMALVLVELLIGCPLFPGRNEYDMLSRITAFLGPMPAVMAERSPRRRQFFDGQMRLRTMSDVQAGEARSRVMGLNDPMFEDLIMKCLVWDPSLRLSAEDALKHPWLNV